MFTSVLSIGCAYRHITQRFRSRTPRRYCHLITLITSVYRKTNVFLITVGTATPPGGKMGEWSPLQYFELKWQMVGSPIYDGQIRVIYVDYLLLSCMPVYTGMLLCVCYMHMIPSFHNKWHIHFKLVLESRPSELLCWQKNIMVTAACICRPSTLIIPKPGRSKF